MELMVVHTPDRDVKRQNGRRFKKPGEPSFMLTAEDKRGIFKMVVFRKLTSHECF